MADSTASVIELTMAFMEGMGFAILYLRNNDSREVFGEFSGELSLLPFLPLSVSGEACMITC
jgi:hypothetical protein